jgi:transcription initiation factor TFIIIB Brf1 subunit/transcription initiation factor TFIIB
MRAHRRSKTILSMAKRRHCTAPAGAAVSAFTDVYTAVVCQQGGRSQSEVAVDVLLFSPSPI